MTLIAIFDDLVKYIGLPYAKAVANIIIMFITIYSVWKDLSTKRKKIVLIMFACAFVLISWYIDEIGEAETADTNKENFMLQSKLSEKADSITLNDREYFTTQIGRLDTITSSLDVLEDSSKTINSKMSDQLHIQNVLSDQTQAIYNVQKRIDYFKKQFDTTRLRNTFCLIENSLDELEFGGGFKDSASLRAAMRSTIQYVIPLLNSQYDNSLLLNDSVLFDRWNYLLSNLRRINWELTGYDRPAIDSVRLHWYTTGVGFNGAVTSRLSQISGSIDCP